MSRPADKVSPTGVGILWRRFTLLMKCESANHRRLERVDERALKFPD